MTTSVEIGSETKDKLEQLQACVKLETGRKVTQQELLDRIISREFESRDALVDSFRDEFQGLSESEAEDILSGTFASGVETTEADVGHVVAFDDNFDGIVDRLDPAEIS